MNRRIYFAGSIRGGREDAGLYKRIIDYINKTDIVVTEHIGQADMSMKSQGTSSELCHWLHFFRSMRNADGQTGAVFLLVKSGWARCPA